MITGAKIIGGHIMAGAGSELLYANCDIYAPERVDIHPDFTGILFLSCRVTLVKGLANADEIIAKSSNTSFSIVDELPAAIAERLRN